MQVEKENKANSDRSRLYNKNELPECFDLSHVPEYALSKLNEDDANLFNQ
jgi:hypothetical protein